MRIALVADGRRPRTEVVPVDEFLCRERLKEPRFLENRPFDPIRNFDFFRAGLQSDSFKGFVEPRRESGKPGLYNNEILSIDHWAYKWQLRHQSSCRVAKHDRPGLTPKCSAMVSTVRKFSITIS